MESLGIYHVITKSIAEYVIFNTEQEYLRMKELLQYYQNKNPSMRYSYFINKKDFSENDSNGDENFVRIIAYCLMPTHVHLIIEGLAEKGISVYMNKVLNAYTRYFNIKHHRKGPLWTGRFKKIEVETNEQLIHLTRYIHLNPVTAYLVSKPEAWKFSSYCGYIYDSHESKLCKFKHVLDIESVEYKNFVDDQICYQRELSKIKHLAVE